MHKERWLPLLEPSQPQFCHFRAISKGPTIISCLILDISSIIHNFSANEAVHKGEHEVSAHVLTMLMNDTVQDEVGQALNVRQDLPVLMRQYYGITNISKPLEQIHCNPV